MIRRFGPGLLAFALVAADLIRPSLQPGIPVFQATLVLLTLALLWRDRLSDLREGGERWALLTLLVLCAFLYLRHPRSLDADGIHYFTYARSLIGDRDLDLANDYGLLGQEMHAKNVLPIGAPLVWGVLLVPLYLVQSLLGIIFGFTVTGAEPTFIAAACLVSISLGCAGLFLLYRELRDFASPSAALLAVLLVWFGSPLRFYMRVLPSFAHAIEFFAGVLVVVASRRLRETGSLRWAVKAGLACGLVYLVRSQDGLLLLVPAIFAFDAWLSHRNLARMIREGASTLAGFASLAWIQSAVWWSMFGTPFLVPHKVLHGEGFAAPAAPKLLEMLLSDRGGLFSTYPVTLIAIAALPFALRRSRPWVISAVLVLLLQWRLNASIFDWYQVRRFTGTIPLIALGLAMVTPRLARAGVLACAVLVALVHQYDVAIDSLRPLPGAPVPIQAALRETADSIAAPVYEGLEFASPWLAVAFIEGYTGSPLLLTGRSDLDLGGSDWWMRLPRPARRFSDVETEDGSLCRFVDGREARLWLPLRGRGELRLSFEIRSIETETPQRFEVEVNGTSLGAQEIAPSWQTVRFVLPETVWREGTNEVVLKFEQAPLFFRLRGYGARAYRAAAIRKITFHQGG
ncbi:MAG: hypothetical protein K1Y01_13585 [Vicinamibacteria bacterium]|nr:hypothetical protein [Vicinamibacteria bacterium]